MEAQKQRVENRTRSSSVSPGVNVVDATFEHLTVLRVLIEGLAGNEAQGFWLKNVHGIPVVPRISPLDLVYLDKDQRVLEAVELLPVGEFPAFRAPAVSALVLPFQTVRATGTAVGDQLEICEAEAVAEEKQAAAASAARQVVLTEPAIIETKIETKPAFVAVHEEPVETQASRREAAEYARSGARTRKRDGGRPRPQKNRQPVARQKENAYRHTPFIVEANAPAAAPTAEPVTPALGERAEEIKPHPAETVATMPQAAKNAKTAKLVRVAASGQEARTTGKRSVKEHLERLLKWLSPNAYNEERRASIRRPAEDLVAYSAQNGAHQRFEVGNISSSGIYLRTEEPWKPGSTVELTLQRSGPMEPRRDRRMDVQAGAVRWGDDGVGLAFDFPEGMHLDLWECAARGKTFETGPEYIVHEMRMARALGTICRICPAAADEAKRMLHKEFSNVRVASAVRIAYIAEEMLVRDAGTEPRLAPVELVVRILDIGSWADAEWIQQMWGGLLATSCTSDGEDQSNAIFIDMLSQLAPVHLRILGIASERAAKPGPVAGPFTVNCCTASELTKALDLSNLTKTLRSVQELADMGLLAAAKRSPSDPQDENARTAITPLGLEMYTRCHGRRSSAVPEEASGSVQTKEPARLGVSYSANAG